MSRLVCAILTHRDRDDDRVADIVASAERLQMGVLFVQGDKAALFAQVSEWKVLPDITVLERPVDMDADDAIRAFADVAPEGETEMMLAGVPNDIDVYRHLKTLGVAEVFVDMPDAARIMPSLESIALRESRTLGIDPRRVVYVWSAAGGAGGSTFALAFASRFAAEGRRTLFVDMDVFAAPGSFMFNAANSAPETTGLLDLLANPARVDALFLERAIQKARENLFYLSSRRRVSDTVFDGKALAAIVARAQQNFDMVVVDTPWRAIPEPDWARVNGPSYIVAPPTPQGLLGFTMLVKELAGAPTKSTITGIINKVGELKGSDIPTKVFAEGFAGKLYLFPYDPQDTGPLFFKQKTLDQISGKAKRPLSAILATLPARAQFGKGGGVVPVAPSSKPAAKAGPLSWLSGLLASRKSKN